MSKILTLLLVSLTSSTAYAWDDSWDNSSSSSKSNSYYTSGESSANEHKTTTPIGSTYNPPRESKYEAYSSPSVGSSRQSESGSGAYRSGNQINDNGLIINRD
jgi:hypothetical protein